MAQHNPYVGPRPFTEDEERFFFGRAEEVEILTSLAVARRASLLFAQSGAGKSSLLMAGLTPRLLRYRRWVRGRETTESLVSGIRIARVGSGVEDAQPGNIFMQSALLSLRSGSDAPPSPDTTLTSALSAWLLPKPPQPAEPDASADTAADAMALPFLLVFDQFEELFTRHTAFRSHREKFFTQVSQALADHECLRVLFSMREDYIAELTPYAHLLPDQLRPRFRLERLKGKAALDAMRGPAEHADVPRPFDSNVAETLRANLQAGGAEDIEPILLQVVCKRLWQELPEDSDRIVLDDVAKYGDVDRALIGYYNDAVGKVVRSAREAGEPISERRVRRFFAESLLTPARTRALVYRDDSNGRTAGLPNVAVDVLTRSDVNIVRGEARGPSHWYELSHDRLIAPVLTSNDEWAQKNTTPLQARLSEWTSRGRLDKDLLPAKDVRAVEDWLQSNPGEVLTPAEDEFLQRSRQGVASALARVRANIDDLGWAVLFAEDDPMRDAIRVAMGPLLEHRRAQTKARFTRYEYWVKPGERAQEFLKRHGALAKSSDDADRMPYYLLIVGDPERIPFEFQYALDTQYAVGRLHLEGLTPHETLLMYARYATSVVESESGRWGLPRHTVVFAPRHDGDHTTAMLETDLVEPMVKELQRPGLTVEEWQVTPVVAELATKGHLLRLLGGDRRPAFLLVAAHGMAWPRGDAHQYDAQGAIVCADWTGRPGPLAAEAYVAAADVPDDASPLGMMMFIVGEFGAGTPKLENRVTDDAPRQLADRAFIARLGQRLLGHPNGGALAVIGHVDTSWMQTFQEFANVRGGGKQWKSEGSDTFVGTVSRLVRGYTVGSAMDFFNARYAQAAAELVDRLLNPAFYGGATRNAEREQLINEAIDVRNYILLGDPAVRVPVEGPVLEQPVSITVDPAVIAAIDASLTTLGVPVSAPVSPATRGPAVPPAPPATTTGEFPTEPGGITVVEPPPVEVQAVAGTDALVVFNGIDAVSGNYAYPVQPLASLARSIISGAIDADQASSPPQADYRSAAASYFDRGT